MGLIGFLASHPTDYIRLKIKDSSLTLRQKQYATNFRFDRRSHITYIARSGPVLEVATPHNGDWVLFEKSDGVFLRLFLKVSSSAHRVDLLCCVFLILIFLKNGTLNI